MDLWENRARIGTASNLQKVLDPADEKGIKNAYIDYYLKSYLKLFLKPNNRDIILEIGSGVGRLVEYLSYAVKRAYGIDYVDKFIEDCNANPSKSENTHYLKIEDTDKLHGLGINKVYIVWVLMYFKSDEDVVKTLSEYRKNIHVNHNMYVIEQVKKSDEVEVYQGSFYCKYRTIDSYLNLFSKCGYEVDNYVVLGERRLGFFAKLLFNRPRIYRILPTVIRLFMPLTFIIDKVFLTMRNDLRTPSSSESTDVVFSLRSR